MKALKVLAAVLALAGWSVPTAQATTVAVTGTYNGSGTVGTTATIPNVACSGPNSVLVAYVGGASGEVPTGVTKGATALTLRKAVNFGGTSLGQIWYLIGASASSESLTATWASSQTAGAAISAVCLSDGHQTLPFALEVTGSGSGTAITGQIVSGTLGEDLVIDLASLSSSGGATISPDPGTSLQTTINPYGGWTMVSGTHASGSNQSPTWTISTSQDWTQIAVVVKASGRAGGGPDGTCGGGGGGGGGGGVPGITSPEARCTELGVNCKCSEMLQATSYTGWPGQSNSVYWNPNDSTTKQCNGQFSPTGLEVGYAFFRGSPGQPLDFYPTTETFILNALPAGHSVERVLRGPDGHQGGAGLDYTWDAGGVEAARRSIRGYVYFSSDYTLVNQDTPTLGCNGKFFQTSNDVKIDRAYGGANVYNFLETVPAQDCCTTGPYPTDGAFESQYQTYGGYGGMGHGSDTTDNYWNGRWWRFEAIITNADASAGNGKRWRLEAYIKNVTDNWPEVKWFDTVDTTQLAVGGAPLVTANRYGNQPFDNMHFNGFRAENVANQCDGFIAYSHFIAASWATDSGQRIGAAVEVEGGLGGGGGGGGPTGGMGGAIKAVGGVRLY